MRKFHLMPLLTLLIGTSYAQVGTWEDLPTLTEVRDIIPLQNDVLMATNGGLLVFDKSSEIFQYGIEGHRSDNPDVNDLYLDEHNHLWLGSRSPGPIVEVINLSTNQYLDVEFVDLDEATSFVHVGDSTYVTYKDGLEGGLLLYRQRSASIEYLDLFNNFPNSNILDFTLVGGANLLNGKLFFRTKHSILWAELDGRNLKDPVNWNVATVPGGESEISDVVPHNAVLLVAADALVYEYDFTSFTELLSAGNTVLDLETSPVNNEFLFATTQGIYKYNFSTGNQSMFLIQSGISGFELNNEDVWIATSNDFLSLFKDQSYTAFSANRPYDDFFNKMMVDDLGQLVGGAQSGISIYSNEGWRTIRAGNYNTAFDASSYNWDQMIIDTLEYFGNTVVEDIVKDDSGNLFFSLQGKGVLKLDDEQPGESKFYNAENGVLEPTYNSDNYILAGQLAVDSQENLWVTTKFVREGGSAISIITPDDAVYHLNQGENGLNSRSIKSIAIDDNDMVWVGSQVRTELQASGGIHFIQVEGELGNGMVVNVSSLIGSPLASNEILQLEVDTHNTLWILTPAGVQSMALPERWIPSSELKSHASLYMTEKESEFYYYWQLTDYNVTGMEIDQRGNHWFLSANAGVHVLQENGRWINGGYGYNTGNSGLLDNQIFSLAFDSDEGKTYFSTPKGVSILNTPFADPKENYSNVHIYPQPFNPDIHDMVVIQGLMDNSSVKILTVSGMLVKELTFNDNDVQGYEAQWDGRDTAGDKVGSGVYILYLYNEEGASASQKLAILR